MKPQSPPDTEAEHIQRCEQIAEHLRQHGATRLSALPVVAAVRQGRGPDKRKRKPGSGCWHALTVRRVVGLPKVTLECGNALRALAAHRQVSIAQVIEDMTPKGIGKLRDI